MKATCAVLLCDATCRIRWISDCPSGLPHDEILGKHPWDFLEGAHAVAFQAAMCVAMSERVPQQIDFASRVIGEWRAWMFFSGLRVAKLAILMRRIPDAVKALSPRERSLCQLVLQGRGVKQIAAEIGYCEKTVDTSLARLCARLKIERKQLAPWCGENHDWF